LPITVGNKTNLTCLEDYVTDQVGLVVMLLICNSEVGGFETLMKYQLSEAFMVFHSYSM